MLTTLIERMNNFTHSQVATKSGIHYNQIWRLATGKDTNPNLSTILKIDEAVTELEAEDPTLTEEG